MKTIFYNFSLVVVVFGLCNSEEIIVKTGAVVELKSGKCIWLRSPESKPGKIETAECEQQPDGDMPCKWKSNVGGFTFVTRDNSKYELNDKNVLTINGVSEYDQGFYYTNDSPDSPIQLRVR